MTKPYTPVGLIPALRDHRARAQWDNWMKDLRISFSLPIDDCREDSTTRGWQSA